MDNKANDTTSNNWKLIQKLVLRHSAMHAMARGLDHWENSLDDERYVKARAFTGLSKDDYLEAIRWGREFLSRELDEMNELHRFVEHTLYGTPKSSLATEDEASDTQE